MSGHGFASGLWLLAAHDPKEHVLSHRLVHLFDVGGRPIWLTDQMMMAGVAAILCVLVLPVVARKQTRVPRGIANLFETVAEYIRNEVARPVLGPRTDRFISYLWTTFFFILCCNLLGMIPVAAMIYVLSGYRWEHLGGTPTANINITAGLAIIAFITIHVSGVREQYSHHRHGHDDGHGHVVQAKPVLVAAVAAFFGYWWSFAPHVLQPEEVRGAKAVALWLVDVVVWVFLFLLECIGALVKPFALAIRLFANMVAGHIVLASLLFMIFTFTGGVAANLGIAAATTVGCVALSLLELFVAFLQAYIFTFLTALFIAAAVAPEH